jgi:predicted nucleic acid-binding protein
VAASVVVDAGFIVAALSRRDRHHEWADVHARQHVPPWLTCEAVLAEAFHLLGIAEWPPLEALLRRRAVIPAFDLSTELDRILGLMEKYRDVQMSLADACLVRMTEIVADPIVLTTDADFRVYRRHGRQVVPCLVP